MDVEIYVGRRVTLGAKVMLDALEQALRDAGDNVVRTDTYQGDCPVMLLYGVGAVENAPVRDRHIAAGGKAVLMDLGYFGRQKGGGYLRFSIDRDHPQHLLDGTPPDPSRFDVFGITLREDCDPSGRVILVGMGHKSRAYLRVRDWEVRKFASLRNRFGARRILYRPKKKPFAALPARVDMVSPIEALLKGAAFLSCRHSNAAVDAVIAGVPFECEDGAAMWLARRPYTPENRLDFLRRLAWWQWKPEEAAQAWAFIKERL